MNDFGFDENAFQQMSDTLKKANESFHFDSDAFDDSLESVRTSLFNANQKEIDRINSKSQGKKSGLLGALRGAFTKK